MIAGAGLVAPRRTVAARVAEHAEALAFGAVMLFAIVVRLVNLPSRMGWDSDQAADATAVFTAVQDGRLPILGPLSSVRSFHHGALYYDLLLPAGWLGHGDPIWLAVEIALLNVAVVAGIWWVARSIGGPLAGFTAGVLAAASTALVHLSVGVWNPFLIGPGATLALVGAFAAWRTGSGRWWLVAALGVDVAAQAHVAATILAVPVVGAYVIAVWRSPGSRRRLAVWGAVASAAVLVTLLPLLTYEVAHDFPESRGVFGYLVLGRSAAPPEVTKGTPVDWPIFVRIPFAGLRLLGWPLTGWPMVSRTAAFLPAVAVAMTLAVGLISRVLAVRARRDDAPAVRHGVYLIAGVLTTLVLVAGFGLKDVAQIQDLPTEQYHAAADPFVIVAAGLVLAAVAHARSAWRGRHLGPAVYVGVLAALLAWNVAWLPPMQSADGGWPAAVTTARNIESLAGSRSIGLASIPAARSPDAYRYPLLLDGATLTSVSDAEVVVVLCDSLWVDGCGGPAEEAWRNENGGPSLKLLSTFTPAPDRTLSVYLRTR